MTAPLPPGWLTIDGAARYFGVGRTTVYRRIQAGDWPTSVLPGMRAKRFSPENIAAIQQAATVVQAVA
jgi:excisionase family DNA binding protein